MLTLVPGDIFQELLIHDGRLIARDHAGISQGRACARYGYVPGDSAGGNTIAGNGESRKGRAADARQADLCGQVLAEDGPRIDKLSAHLRIAELVRHAGSKDVRIRAQYALDTDAGRVG